MILLSWAAWIYGAILKGIRWAYRRGFLKVHHLSVPVVSVGNLTWGGTGKTPMVMKLAQTFSRKGKRVAVLTRGYGKDEVALLKKNLDPIPVLVGPDRVASGRRAIEEHGVTLLILDDGFQQWRLKKDVEILLVDASAPFGNGFLIPRGSLREPPAAASKADLMVVTKTELADDRGRGEAQRRLRRVNPAAPIFFARYQPEEIHRWPGEERLPVSFLKGKEVATLAGIARPESFEATVQNCGATIGLRYRVNDHHPYTMGEMIRLMLRCKRRGIRWLVTTAKDAVRIPGSLPDFCDPRNQGVELLVLQVQLELTPDESEFFHRIDSLLAR